MALDPHKTFDDLADGMMNHGVGDDINEYMNSLEYSVCVIPTSTCVCHHAQEMIFFLVSPTLRSGQRIRANQPCSLYQVECQSRHCAPFPMRVYRRLHSNKIARGTGIGNHNN